MKRTQIFLSYDPEHDSDLLDLVASQSALDGAQFEIACRSVDDEMSNAWTDRVRRDVASVEEVVVLCGEHTKDSQRMALELATAQEEGKPYLLLWGRRNVMCTKPATAAKSDAMYSWEADTLGVQIGIVFSRWTAKQNPRKPSATPRP